MTRVAYKHHIILSSSYSTRTRIGLDIIDDDCGFEDAVSAVRMAYDGKTVPFSIHMMSSDSESWESIVRKDPYFDDVRLIPTVEEFVELIRAERYLKGMDVARYILSKRKCSHTKLEKLVYLCYADYLCEFKSPLFTDRIYAFKYGPVVETVYRRYRERPYEIEPHEIEPQKDTKSRWTKSEPMAIRSRLLFSEDGIQKTYSIDRTIERYMWMSAEELVELTHRDGAPWTHVERTGWHDQITDEIIMRYHRYEV